MGMRDQFSETQIQQQEKEATMIALLQGIAVSQQQTALLLTRLLREQGEQGNGGVAAQAAQADQAAAQPEAQVPIRQQGGDDDDDDDDQGNNNNNNEQEQAVQPAPLAVPIPDVRAHEVVVPPPMRQRAAVRTVANSLVEGGVALVQITGCPASFKLLVQQWEVQRLNRFISSRSRRFFSTSQKNAWTKWSRFYNMLLSQCGFRQLQAGVSPFPMGTTRVETNRQMLEAADYFDSQRRGDSMDKFYKEVRGNGQRDGDLGRVYETGEFRVFRKTFFLFFYI